MVLEKPSREDRTAIIASIVGAIGAVIAALVGFFFTYFQSPKSNPPAAPPPTAYAYAGLSFTGTVGIDFDTNPPTVGPASSSSFIATDNINRVDLTAKLPASLADITNNTANPPSLSACQTAITHGSTLRLTVATENWVCVRTAEGATKAVLVTNITSSSAEMQVYALSR